MDNNFRKSLFEIEAERQRELNKGKEAEKGAWKWKLLGYGMGILIGLGIFIPATIYGVIVHAFVAMKLWQWFVVPVFHLPALGMMQMAGICFLVRIFTYQANGKLKFEGESAKEKVIAFVGILLVPWYSLFLGWFVHLFL